MLVGLIQKMLKSDIDTVVIAFPNQLLKNKDFALYAKLQLTFPGIKIYPVAT